MTVPLPPPTSVREEALRRGWLTSEFLIAMAAVAVVAIMAILDRVNPDVLDFLQWTVGAYVGGRAVIKAGAVLRG